MNQEHLKVALTEWAESIAREQDSTSQIAPSQEFLLRARQVARRVESFRKMRSATAEMGFQPLALPHFLQCAARLAKVSLESLFASRRDEALTQWMDVGIESGLTRRLTQLLARLWLAESRDRDTSLPVMARGNSDLEHPRRLATAKVNSESELETLLRAVEKSYSDEDGATLRAIKNRY